MTSIIDALETVQAVDERLEDLDRRRDDHVQRMSVAGTEHRTAVVQWQAEADKTFRAGKDFNKPRPTPRVDPVAAREHLDRLNHERRQLERERHQAVLAAAEEITGVVAEGIKSEVERSKVLVDQLSDVVQKISDLQTDLDQVDGSRFALNPNSTLRESRDRVTIEALIAVAQGRVPVERFVDTRRILNPEQGRHLEIHSDGSSHPPNRSPEERARIDAHRAQADWRTLHDNPWGKDQPRTLAEATRIQPDPRGGFRRA